MLGFETILCGSPGSSGRGARIARRPYLAAFNELLDCNLGCPRCGRTFVGDVQLGFGVRQGDCYRLGDRIAWKEGAPAKYGGRPEGERAAGYGWTTCKLCGGDFDVRVLIDGDTPVGVEPDLLHLPDSSDEAFDLDPCPGCGRSGTANVVCVTNFQIGRIYCTCAAHGHQVLLAEPFVRGVRPEIIGAPQPWVPSTFNSYG